MMGIGPAFIESLIDSAIHLLLAMMVTGIIGVAVFAIGAGFWDHFTKS